MFLLLVTGSGLWQRQSLARETGNYVCITGNYAGNYGCIIVSEYTCLFGATMGQTDTRRSMFPLEPLRKRQLELRSLRYWIDNFSLEDLITGIIMIIMMMILIILIITMTIIILGVKNAPFSFCFGTRAAEPLMCESGLHQLWLRGRETFRALVFSPFCFNLFYG